MPKIGFLMPTAKNRFQILNLYPKKHVLKKMVLKEKIKIFSRAPRDDNYPSNVSSMYDGGISIETYSAGAGRDVASMVDHEQLKCTATLPLWGADSRKNFSALLLF